MRNKVVSENSLDIPKKYKRNLQRIIRNRDILLSTADEDKKSVALKSARHGLTMLLKQYPDAIKNPRISLFYKELVSDPKGYQDAEILIRKLKLACLRGEQEDALIVYKDLNENFGLIDVSSVLEEATKTIAEATASNWVDSINLLLDSNIEEALKSYIQSFRNNLSIKNMAGASKQLMAFRKYAVINNVLLYDRMSLELELACKKNMLPVKQLETQKENRRLQVVKKYQGFNQAMKEEDFVVARYILNKISTYYTEEVETDKYRRCKTQLELEGNGKAKVIVSEKYERLNNSDMQSIEEFLVKNNGNISELIKCKILKNYDYFKHLDIRKINNIGQQYLLNEIKEGIGKSQYEQFVNVLLNSIEKDTHKHTFYAIKEIADCHYQKKTLNTLPLDSIITRLEILFENVKGVFVFPEYISLKNEVLASLKASQYIEYNLLAENAKV